MSSESGSTPESRKSSTRSQKSRTRTSNSRSSKSSVHSRSDTAVEAAELKVKLKYIDLEAKSRADLERVQTLRQLDIVQAKLDVLDELDQRDQVSVLGSESGSYCREYVEAHAIVTDSSHRATNVDNCPISTTVPFVSNNVSMLKETVLNPHVTEFMPSSDVKTNHPGDDLALAPNTMTHSTRNANHGDISINMPDKGFEYTPVRPQTESVPKAGVNASSPSNIEQGLLELAKSLADQVHISRLPTPEPNVFDGDPLKYPSWKAAFQTLIEQKQVPAAERMYYLKRYLSGPVKEVVENYFLLSSDEAYDGAKALLDKRYGDSFVVANAFRDKLEGWPKIASRDSTGLRKFGDFLRQCHSAMQDIGNLNVLNDERENRKVLVKLPDWIVTRWARVASQRREDTGHSPPFGEFVRFIDKEATIACDPVTSLQSLYGKSDRTDGKHERQRPTGRSLFTEVSENAVKTHTSCALCHKAHDVDNCRLFLEKSLDKRKEFVKTKHLCYGCLREGHLSRKCRQRKQCRICSKYHPTSLHGDTKTQSKPPENMGSQNVAKPPVVASQSSIAHMTDSGVCSKSSMVVPVYVSHCDNPSNERLVYALLDTQSDTTFILDETCEALGLTGTNVQLKLSTMLAENKLVDSRKVKGLAVRAYNNDTKLSLPDTYTRNVIPANRSHIPTQSMANKWPYLEHVAQELMPPNDDCEVGLLIGYNCTRALTPRDIVSPKGDGPYGQKTDLGWGIVGIVDPDYTGCPDADDVGLSHRVMTCLVPHLQTGGNQPSSAHHVIVCRTQIKEVINPAEVATMMELDFSENKTDTVPMSLEDENFLKTVTEGITKTSGDHYEMPLPFKRSMPHLPNNKNMAYQRFRHLKRRLLADPQYRDHYFAFMQDLIQKGYAESIPDTEPKDGHAWYIPHHGVYHPQKPGKIRVVFDCSAKCNGESLNDHLLQGPDLTNALVGVLCRFRKEPVAFTCDIEQMFYQFQVPVKHRDYLRFWWFQNNDMESDPIEYRMTVHIFGAVSSPGCANFGLKQLANDSEPKFGSEVANFVRHDFYVDDGLKSLPNVEEAIEMVVASKEMCKSGGLRLHKFLSSSKEVIRAVPQEDRAKGIKDLDLLRDKLPIERALGIQWCIESDTFQFRIVLNERPPTRRGVLSTISSVYDPLGFISPFILVGKQILQQMCKDQTDWDSPLTEPLMRRWERWLNDLSYLGSLKIKRCVKPDDFGNVKVAELHHFSDASTEGYGQCSYLKLVNDQNQVHCSLMFSKSRVTPLRPITIPRLELTAALVSVKVSALLSRELTYPNVTHHFWTDSQVVLGYIANEARRFHVFVANRVQQIRERTEPSQWGYVSSCDNPADLASRGATAEKLQSETAWLNGPRFLWNTELPSSQETVPLPEISVDDPEVKRVQVFSIKTDQVLRSSTCILERIEYFSDWQRAKRAIAICLKFKALLRDHVVKKPSSTQPKQDIRRPIPRIVGVEDLQQAEIEIIKQVQNDAFADETEKLHSLAQCVENPHQGNTSHGPTRRVSKSSALHRLDPFLHVNGVLRVGGRIRRGDFSLGVRHPVVLPRKSHVTELLIRHFHERVAHQGRGMTSNEIRASGFWIIGCSSAVSYHISKCLKCRKQRGAVQEQKMADLPVDRMDVSPPFTYSGVDFVGPFYIKEGRKELKRYGVLFTCMSSRAIHLETANSLDTDSFVNSLRRFISIRGPVRQLRCDSGSNFVGAQRELKEALSEMDESQLQMYLRGEGCDYIEFKMNVPSASHMGGVWERQIGSVRSVLSSLMDQAGAQLDDESLRTFMCEAAAIVNGRPLTVANINDPVSAEPLTPNHLLTMKSRVILPPPGVFQRADLYARKRWRRVQHLANEFWHRWQKEFLYTLQRRSKWVHGKRDMHIGDIVLVKDDHLARSQWKLGRVIETFVDDDTHVRKVKLALGDRALDSTGRRVGQVNTVERPVQKLVLLRETEEFPVKEP